jgi:hypothetical protein
MLTLHGQHSDEFTEKQVFDVVSGGRIIYNAHLTTCAGGALCCFVDKDQFMKIYVDFPNDLQRPFNSKYRVDLIAFPSEVYSDHAHYELYMETLRINMEDELIPFDAWEPFGTKIVDHSIK